MWATVIDVEDNTGYLTQVDDSSKEIEPVIHSESHQALRETTTKVLLNSHAIDDSHTVAATGVDVRGIAAMKL